MFLIASAFASAFTKRNASCVPEQEKDAKMTSGFVRMARNLNLLKQC